MKYYIYHMVDLLICELDDLVQMLASFYIIKYLYSYIYPQQV